MNQSREWFTVTIIDNNFINVLKYFRIPKCEHSLNMSSLLGLARRRKKERKRWWACGLLCFHLVDYLLFLKNKFIYNMIYIEVGKQRIYNKSVHMESLFYIRQVFNFIPDKENLWLFHLFEHDSSYSICMCV